MRRLAVALLVGAWLTLHRQGPRRTLGVDGSLTIAPAPGELEGRCL